MTSQDENYLTINDHDGKDGQVGDLCAKLPPERLRSNGVRIEKHVNLVCTPTDLIQGRLPKDQIAELPRKLMRRKELGLMSGEGRV